MFKPRLHVLALAILMAGIAHAQSQNAPRFQDSRQPSRLPRISVSPTAPALLPLAPAASIITPSAVAPSAAPAGSSASPPSSASSTVAVPIAVPPTEDAASTATPAAPISTAPITAKAAPITPGSVPPSLDIANPVVPIPNGPAPQKAARADVTPVNMMLSTTEVQGRVPNHLVWLRPSLQMMQDPVDGQLVFIDDDGHVIGRASLPAKFRISLIALDLKQVRLIEASGLQQVIVPRAVKIEGVTRLPNSEVDRNAPNLQLRSSRMGPKQRQLEDAGRRLGSARLDVRSVSGGTLATTYEIGPPSDNDRYIVSEEIVASLPNLRIRVIVQRFDRTGSVSGVAHVPLDEMDVVPRNFISVTEDGTLRILVPTAQGVKIRELIFSPPPFINSGAGKLREEDLKVLGDSGREISVDTNIIPQPDPPNVQPTGKRFGLKIATPPISRAKTLTNARAYLSVNWVMEPGNYSKPGIDNLCQPEAAKFWLRPANLTRDLIGKTIGPMPYRWGGDDTPESFKLRVQWGALAGDVCTCREPSLNYCLVPESAGVDCSGFVSKSWGIEKRGTWGLLDVSKELGDITEMHPGDAFIRPGHHVRLMTGSDSGSYLVLESTTSLECEGVCESTYRPSELNGFQLIRYSGISD